MNESDLVPGWEKKINPEQAIAEITERIIDLRRKWPNGIPKDIQDTSDATIEREKLKHPARMAWFANMNLMLDELSMYLSRGLINISSELSEEIRKYENEMGEKLSKIEPDEAIPHQYITQACVLFKKVLKEINPAAAEKEYGNGKK